MNSERQQPSDLTGQWIAVRLDENLALAAQHERQAFDRHLTAEARMEHFVEAQHFLRAALRLDGELAVLS